MLFFSKSFLTTTILSTYTISIIILLCHFFNNIVWSEWLWWYLNTNIDFVNFPNYALKNCFNSYNNFFNLYTFWLYLSSKKARRKAFFTLNYCNGQSRFAIKDNKTWIVLVLIVGVKYPYVIYLISLSVNFHH